MSAFLVGFSIGGRQDRLLDCDRIGGRERIPECLVQRLFTASVRAAAPTAFILMMFIFRLGDHLDHPDRFKLRT